MNNHDIQDLFRGILPKRYMKKLAKKIKHLENQKTCELCHHDFQDEGCLGLYGYVLNPLKINEIKLEIKRTKDQMEEVNRIFGYGLTSSKDWRESIMSSKNLDHIYACRDCYRPLKILMDKFINNQ